MGTRSSDGSKGLTEFKIPYVGSNSRPVKKLFGHQMDHIIEL